MTNFMRKINLQVLLIMVFLLYTTIAFSLEHEPEDESANRLESIGANTQLCEMCFKRSHGGKIFKNQNFGGSVFLGIKINDYLSLEPGYQYMSATKKAIIYAEDNLFGITVPSGASPSLFKSKLTMDGPYLDFILKLKMLEDDKFKPFVGIGFWSTNAKFSRDWVLTNFVVLSSKKTFESQKILKRFIVGFNYHIKDDLSLSFRATHVNTGKLYSRQVSGTMFRLGDSVSPKNSMCYSIGFGHHF